MQTPQRIGQGAERIAARYLEAQGLCLVSRNYRCRHGEIDLVMRDDAADCLVFVEVRYRRRSRYGGAAASVTARKRRRLAMTALHYLQRHACTSDQRLRVDVVAIAPALAGVRQTLTIDWIVNIDLPMTVA